ncbi:cytochrome P450 3A4-like [Centruroides sculpturatus]|uniref:cytochrome P450 3A4-like n=1 Tax=Centruroides sculpturatus TaxID=218467 RepID=UPI000C6DB7E9|nr:cytochrome P450 3A4-like [Centruroides sculpturatus]
MLLQVTLPLTFLLLFLWYQWRKRHFQVFLKLGIPGPQPNVIFGNFLEVFRNGFIETHKKWIKKYGKVVGYYIGLKPVLLVTDTDLLKNIQIKEFHKFPNRPLLYGERVNTNDKRRINLLFLKGTEWKEMRSLVTPSFTTSKMKMMSPIMNDSIDTLLENLNEKCQSGETFDVYTLFKRLTIDVIGRTAFGIQTNVQKNPDDPLLRLAHLMFNFPFQFISALISSAFNHLSHVMRLFRLFGGFRANKGRHPVEELFDRCKVIIETRRENPSQKKVDLLQQLIDAEVKENTKVDDESLIAGDTEKENMLRERIESNEGKKSRHLTTDELISNAFLFLLAGYETTSTALAFCTMMLVNYPEVQENIRREVNELLEREGCLNYDSVHKLQYLDAVFSEILRLYPPIYLFVNRETVEDAQYGSYKIPKGMAIQVPVYLLHRDEDYWPDAEKFIPERFFPENRNKNNPMAWQPFGSGPRNCVGMRFAQMEAKMAIAKILKKFYLKPCKNTDKHPLKLQVGLSIIRPKYGVPIKVEYV